MRLQATAEEGTAGLVRAGVLGAGERGQGGPEELIGAVLAELGRDEAVAVLSRAGVPAAPARRAGELAADPDLVGYEVLHPDPRPGRSTWWTAGRHARFSRTERRGTLVAPSLGQHTRVVLVSAGLTLEEVEELLASGAAAERRG